jgi:hypothetical protein
MRSDFKLVESLSRAAIVIFSLSTLVACGKSEPVYSGISTMGRNYLPYNMDGFTITDAYGNKASGGGDEPPGGGGIACCYKLKGTEFTVKWDYYDVDQWHKGDERMFHAETKVSMPSMPIPDKVGTRILEVHFYPDRHVEFAGPLDVLALRHFTLPSRIFVTKTLAEKATGQPPPPLPPGALAAAQKVGVPLPGAN